MIINLNSDVALIGPMLPNEHQVIGYLRQQGPASLTTLRNALNLIRSDLLRIITDLKSLNVVDFSR